MGFVSLFWQCVVTFLILNFNSNFKLECCEEKKLSFKNGIFQVSHDDFIFFYDASSVQKCNEKFKIQKVSTNCTVEVTLPYP